MRKLVMMALCTGLLTMASEAAYGTIQARSSLQGEHSSLAAKKKKKKKKKDVDTEAPSISDNRVA